MRLVFIMEENIIRLREGKGNATFTNVIWVSLSQNDVDGKFFLLIQLFFQEINHFSHFYGLLAVLLRWRLISSLLL
jgi:hypothetical protein